MEGLQLTADLRGCDAAKPAMSQADALRRVCLDAVREVGLTPVGELFHAFAPAASGRIAGVTGVVLLAESHLAVHTWPEQGAVTVDVYVCNFGVDNSRRAEALLDALLKAFAPGDLRRASWRRGGDRA